MDLSRPFWLPDTEIFGLEQRPAIAASLHSRSSGLQCRTLPTTNEINALGNLVAGDVPFNKTYVF